MRPNLFANTPDILHAYLQRGGRPAFQVRLVLAATLGASYGIYSGFELCENVPVADGTEEYLDSEKYQIRPRDWDAAGQHRGADRARQPRSAASNPALQHDWRAARSIATDNAAAASATRKTIARRRATVILVVVNLDPFNMQHGLRPACRSPSWALTPASRVSTSHDLLAGRARITWRGEWNYVRLDPGVAPAHILRIDGALSRSTDLER